MSGRVLKLIGRVLLPRRGRDFVRSESGVTAIEFGLLAVPFFTIIGAILETSVVFLSGQVLDSAVHDASRLIRTGQVQAVGMSAATFKQRICDRLYGLFSNCNQLHVEVQLLTTFNATNISAPVDMTGVNRGWTRPEVFTPGVGSSIVLVQVYYKWPVILGAGNLTLANLPDGKRILGAATVFRNEPFG